MWENIGRLLLSVTLSAGRGLTSKKTAAAATTKAQFFCSQTVLFIFAFLLLLCFYATALASVSPVTTLYGAAYGVLLISSQWMYTISLKNGNTSLCTLVYSLGFVFPTLSGVAFWGERFMWSDALGLLFALAVILLTAKTDSGGTAPARTFLPFLLIATVSSGGLGILQKVQQSSSSAGEVGAFLLTAFGVAAAASLTGFLLCGQKAAPSVDAFLYPALTGVCFGGANLCNTLLAGRMQSAVFFPVQNISTILLTAVCSAVLFKERFTVKIALALLCGAVAVLFFS